MGARSLKVKQRPHYAPLDVSNQLSGLDQQPSEDVFQMALFYKKLNLFKTFIFQLNL